MPSSTDEAILNELVAIKKLIAFALLQQPGITQTDVANALGTSQAQVSRMFAKPGAKSSTDAKDR
jgi:predicted transcriptional regulator